MNEQTQATMFSSDFPDWETPPQVMAYIADVMKRRIVLDVCATDRNAKAPFHISASEDALQVNWPKRIATLDNHPESAFFYMNPPYGRGVGKWIRHAMLAAITNPIGGGVCLLPARTDVEWFHDYVHPIIRREVNGEVVFWRGRLPFMRVGEFVRDDKGRIVCAPFPSMLVTFFGNNAGTAAVRTNGK
jgi:DNA N-6-adenine-methyltransferase (Dam)